METTKKRKTPEAQKPKIQKKQPKPPVQQLTKEEYIEFLIKVRIRTLQFYGFTEKDIIGLKKDDYIFVLDAGGQPTHLQVLKPQFKILIIPDNIKKPELDFFNDGLGGLIYSNKKSSTPDTSSTDTEKEEDYIEP